MRKGFIQPINYIKSWPPPHINRFRGLPPTPIRWTLVTPSVDQRAPVLRSRSRSRSCLPINPALPLPLALLLSVKCSAPAPAPARALAFR